jgi:hypothetical protein
VAAAQQIVLHNPARVLQPAPTTTSRRRRRSCSQRQLAASNAPCLVTLNRQQQAAGSSEQAAVSSSHGLRAEHSEDRGPRADEAHERARARQELPHVPGPAAVLLGAQDNH